MSGSGSLSQDQVDALLAGGVADEAADVAPDEAPLSADERDAIGEVGNISMSSAATALSAMLGHPVSITTPRLDLVTEREVRDGVDRPAAVTFIDFTAGLTGQNVLVLGTREASVVADLMMGQEPTELDDELNELQLSAVSEAMNQMMGSAATAMAEMLGTRVDITSPRVRVLDPSDESDAIGLSGDERLVRVCFQLRVGDIIDTALMQLMPVDFARDLVGRLVAGAPSGAEPADAVDGGGAEPAPVAPGPEAAVREAVASAPPAPEPAAEPSPAPHLAEVAQPVVHPVTFPSLDDAPSAPPAGDMSLLMDVPLQVTVELGRTRLRIRNVLDLAPGSIVELDRLAGEPVDVLVNGKPIARGEVVVINEEFGVRITEVAHPATRLRGVAAEG